MKRLLILLLLVPGLAAAQNVATCAPGATSAWGTAFLPCSVTVTFVVPAQLTAAQSIAVQRASVNEWLPFSALLSTDAVWTDAIRPGTTTQWWPVTTVPNMPALGGTPPVTLPVTPPVTTTGSGGSVTVSWMPVTQNTDGTAASLTGYLLQYGSSDFSNQLNVSPLSSSATVTGLTPGPFQVQALAVASYGTSNPSASATATVRMPATPGAPAVQSAAAALTTTGTQVYIATQVPDGWAFTPVGTVPMGSPCDATQGVNGMNVVPRTASLTVTWLTAVQPLALMAPCH